MSLPNNVSNENDGTICFMFVVAFSVAPMEKYWVYLSSESISTVDQEPFMENCYRSFFYTKIKARNHKNAW
jgi:hypothetical protein